MGGEISYQCLGNDNYAIKLRVYRDCGGSGAQFDNFAIITIFDINGRRVFSQDVSLHDTVNINAENLRTGLYLIQIDGVDYTHTAKLIIN